jgi:cytochrome c biogenesis protein CcmG/thiol:disulfide interchange protein DsbE
MAEYPGRMRWIAIGVAALLVGLLAYGVTAQGTSTSIDQALSEGRRVAAPDATLPRLGATGTGSLKQYRGKVVLVNFWASWCPPCIKELPLLERTHRKIAGKGGLIVGINTRDASEDALKFVDRFHLTFPSLRDGPGDFAEEWGLTGYPETFVLDREGRVAAARRGPIDQAWIDATLPKLLDEPS